jgi:hypothetical protein
MRPQDEQHRGREQHSPRSWVPAARARVERQQADVQRVARDAVRPLLDDRARGRPGNSPVSCRPNNQSDQPFHQRRTAPAPSRAEPATRRGRPGHPRSRAQPADEQGAPIATGGQSRTDGVLGIVDHAFIVGRCARAGCPAPQP